MLKTISFTFLIFILILSLVIWGVFRSIPNRAMTGILWLEGGDIYNETIPAEGGRVTDIFVKPGDKIEKGKVIAYLERPELLAKLNLEKEHLVQLQAEETRLKETVEGEKTTRYQLLEQQRQDILRAQEINTKNLEDIQNLLKFKEESLKNGFVVMQDVEITRRDYYEAKEKQEDLQLNLSQLKTQEEDFNDQWRQRLKETELNVLAEQLKVNAVQAEMDSAREVVNTMPGTGIVIRVNMAVGKTVPDRGSVISMIAANHSTLNNSSSFVITNIFLISALQLMTRMLAPSPPA